MPNSELHNFWQSTGDFPYNSGPRSPKNRHLIWLQPDIEEQWRRNPGKYTPESVDYTHNNYGYRINNRDWNLDAKTKMFALGCSNTFGVGINVNDIWPELVNKSLGAELFNFGVSGGTSDTVSRILYLSLQVTVPEYVFILWPEANRYDDYHDPVICPGDQSDFPVPQRRSAWNLVPEILKTNQLYNNYQRNKLFVQLLSKVYHFKLIELEWEIEKSILDSTEQSQILSGARDGMHPSEEFHRLIADKFITLASKT